MDKDWLDGVFAYLDTTPSFSRNKVQRLREPGHRELFTIAILAAAEGLDQSLAEGREPAAEQVFRGNLFEHLSRTVYEAFQSFVGEGAEERLHG